MPRELANGETAPDFDRPIVPVVSGDTLSELDKLRDELLSKEADPPKDEPEPPKTEEPEPPKTEEPEPPKTEEPEPPKTENVDPLKTDDATSKTDIADPAKTDAPKEKTDDSGQPADEFAKRLDAVELPPHARPKSAESFTRVKEIAKQEVASVRQQLEAEKAARLAAEEKAKAAVAKEEFDKLRAEAEELRKFKLSKDIESDPRLAQFDKTISDNDAAILAKFAEVGGKPEQIEEIKKLGGPRKIDWEPLFKHMTLPQRRFIESKLVESEGVAYNRAKALESAKADVDAWQKEYEQRRFKTAEQEIAKAEWLRPIELKPNATAEEKAAASAQNQRVKQLKARIDAAIADTSPEMHATLAVGTALAHDLHWQLTQLVAIREQEKAKMTEENVKTVEALTKERDALKAELDKIKNASRGARPGSVAGGRSAAVLTKPGAIDLSKSTSDVLDDLARQAAA